MRKTDSDILTKMKGTIATITRVLKHLTVVTTPITTTHKHILTVTPDAPDPVLELDDDGMAVFKLNHPIIMNAWLMAVYAYVFLRYSVSSVDVKSISGPSNVMMTYKISVHIVVATMLYIISGSWSASILKWSNPLTSIERTIP